MWLSTGKAAVALSIEAYLMVNLLMDTFLTALALRAAGQPVRPKVLLSGLIGSVYALLCRLGFLDTLPVQGLVMLLMLAVACDIRRAPFRLIAAMTVGTLCAGGVLQYAMMRRSGMTGFFGALASCCVLLVIVQDRRRMDLSCLTVRVCVHHGGRSAAFDALIDTGNRLREPFTGLPVLIVESHLVAGLLPQNGMPLRRIPFGGLGGSGYLKAFRPERIEYAMGEMWHTAPEVWIAMYPHSMSGAVHALAPPAFAWVHSGRTDRIREERL